MTTAGAGSSKRRPTLKTVAKIADLAVTTVSRALADDPKIAKATRERVAQIASDVGYVPDRAAQRLRTGKTKVLSLVLDPHNEILGFCNALIVGLTRALQGTDYHLNITPHFAGGDGQTPVQHIVHNRLADGIAFSRTRPKDDRARYLLEQQFPFVSHGRTELGPHAYVDFDNHAFAAQAVNLLADRGAQRICLIPPPSDLTFHRHLSEGLAETAAARGITAEVPSQITLESTLTEINAWAVALAQQPDRPDGFICPGEASCIAVINALRQHGLQRGRDFGIVAKVSSELLAQMDPGLDTILEDIEEAGLHMGRALLDQLTSPGHAPRQHIMTPPGPAKV